MSDGLRTDELTIPQGVTWGRTYPVTSPDLTGYTGRAQVRTSKASGTVLHEWSTTNGDLIIDPVAKTVTLKVAPATSTAWTWTDGVFDVLLTSGDSNTVLQLVQGTVTVDQTVTR